jgi:hypothetical protein
VITRLRPPLDHEDLGEPIVAVLALADLALEALVVAFFAQHPRLEHESFLHPDAWDSELRHAQLAAALARALQAALADYAALTAERLVRNRHDDSRF